MKKDFSSVKFKKMAKVLQIIMRFLFWVSISGMILSVLAFPVLFFITHGDLTLQHFVSWNGSVSINLDSARGLSFILPNQVLAASTDLTRIIVNICGTLFMYSIALALLFKEIGNVLGTVATNTPFEEKNSKRVKNIGVVLIVSSVLFNAMATRIFMSIIEAFHIKNINVSSSVDTFMLLIGIFMLILSGIFKYGAYLQNEVDSTL